MCNLRVSCCGGARGLDFSSSSISSFALGRGERGSLQVCCSAGKENVGVQVEIAVLYVTNPLPGSLPAGAGPNTEEVRRGQGTTRDCQC